MENDQKEVKTENVNNDTNDEVKSEKPISNVEENSTKETLTSEEPSSELLAKIKNQIEVLFHDIVNNSRCKIDYSYITIVIQSVRGIITILLAN